jgi:transposase
VIERRFRHPGRKRLDDRKVLCGILFVVYTGIPWRFLPTGLGFGSGMACRRRLREWHEARVWRRLHELLLAELRAAGVLEYAERGYDHEVYRDKVRRFEITAHIARRDTEHGCGLGVHRWVVEGAIALLHWLRCLRIRWEIRDDIH